MDTAGMCMNGNTGMARELKSRKRAPEYRYTHEATKQREQVFKSEAVNLVIQRC